MSNTRLLAEALLGDRDETDYESRVAVIRARVAEVHAASATDAIN
jgi:hypothetical protein